MSEIIVKLLNGELEPIAYIGKDNHEMKKLFSFMETTLEKIENTFEGENRKLFEKYYDYIQEYIKLICEESFSAGYCMGTKITAEALINCENVTLNN